jgi:hypothetical protein
VISPIPRGLLPHTATYKKFTGVSARGVPTFATAVTLNFVRFEVAKKNAFTSLGEQRNDSLIMFFDCFNSLPVGTVFNAQDVVTYEGQDYIVREDIPEPAIQSRPHHYEVALV